MPLVIDHFDFDALDDRGRPARVRGPQSVEVLIRMPARARSQQPEGAAEVIARLIPTREVWKEHRRLSLGVGGTVLAAMLAVVLSVSIPVILSTLPGIHWWELWYIALGAAFSAGAAAYGWLEIKGVIDTSGRGLPSVHEVLTRVARDCFVCGFPLSDLRAESDGCVVCPECGAAWRLGAQADRRH